ncbi:nucleotide excision repair endonuclease [Paraclostridium dentum]|uniref:nucleotide excision repair endonuclease n=1 Tax=Paraclostridium dentum TaxID=2662455 RepID=UPI00147371A1|nr:nucleotide excision repair endonuclease [Paraclostridium dentum]
MFERKGYVYKMIDISNQVLYVGKTVNMTRRMKQHFSNKSHLYGRGLYENVQRIEYLTCKNEYESLQTELYYINFYKPKFNKESKIADFVAIDNNINKNWKVWKVLKSIPLEQQLLNERYAKYMPVAMGVFFIATILTLLL